MSCTSPVIIVKFKGYRAREPRVDFGLEKVVRTGEEEESLGGAV